MSDLNPEAIAESVIQTIQSALRPVLERLAVAEARLEPLGALRERVATVETKAIPSDPMLIELLDRLVVVETKAAVQVPVDLSDVTQRLAVLEGESASPEDLAASLTGLLRKELAALEPPPRMQRRLIRDATGTRVVEEPVE